MPTAVLRGPEGGEAGTVELPGAAFGGEVHGAVLHQALLRQLAGARQGTHDTKTRGEVSGGGRKPYRQKGTGRARQGSIRAPQWRGGGTIFGPTPRGYGQSMPRKQRLLALRSALAARAADGVIQVVKQLEYDRPKTAKLATFLDKVEAGRRVLLVLSERSENVELSARNIPQLKLVLASNLSVRDLLTAETVVFTQAAVDAVGEHLA
ncbi:MAG TPA: 50S ribosomal protein L4 [Candidatus Acidoferrales bacterium]|nr:50S ribosomal protein L4 [Candidatus Acidoferrales bacterium]